MRNTTKGTWGTLLWPVRAHEVRKVVPLMVLKALVSFVYGILLCMKDTLVVTAAGSGAEVIPVLKGLVVLPCSILFILLYTKLSNTYRPSSLCYGIITFFMLFFLAYSFYMFPNVERLSPHATAAWLHSYLGPRYGYLVAVYLHWVPSCFFVIAELWGQVAIFLLFWGLANRVCSVEEAKRGYPLMIAAGSFSFAFTGPLVSYYTTRYGALGFAWTLKCLMMYVIGACVLILITYWWLIRFVLTPQMHTTSCSSKELLEGEEKTALSLWQSIKYIFSSPYLLAMATTVIGCGLAINLVEVTFKANLKVLYPVRSDYQAFMATTQTYLGILSCLTLLFLTGNLLKKFSWRWNATVSPIVVGGTGALFFLMSYCKGYLHPLAAMFNTTPLHMVVWVGALQSLTSKVMKYSFFDATKEMMYIPLDKEAKTKGKAVVDILGSRLGKSGSSYLHLALLCTSATGSVLTVTMGLLPILLFVVFCWIMAVNYMAKYVDKKEERFTR